MHQSELKKLWALAARSAIEPLEVRRMLSVSFSRTDWAAGNDPHKVAVGDFNSDGRADLAVINVNDDEISILIGDDSGGFSAPTSFSSGVGFYPNTIDVADFNGDGLDDLAVGIFYFGFSIFTGNGNGGFSEPAHFETDTGITDAEVGDFNNDGRLDLAATNAWPVGFNSGFGSGLNVLMANSSGGFYEPYDYGIGQIGSIVAGDFNGDGHHDLALGNYYDNNGGMILIGNDSNEGTFWNPPPGYFDTGYSPHSIVVGDFNGDGRDDLAVANWDSDDVTINIGDGSGGFSAPTHFAAGQAPLSVAIGDFNGDGRADLAVANIHSDNVSILTGDGNGAFSPPTNFATGETPASLAVGDFNGDGRADLAVACFDGGVTLLTNLSTAQWPYNPSNPFIANSPWHIPGKIEFENYDVGGEGTAYHDSTSFNSDGVYRSGGVDIVEGGTEYQLYDTHPGEWTAYTVTVPAAGMYQLDVFASASGTDARFHMTVDGVDVTGPLTPHDFHSDNSNGLTTLGGIALSAGEHEIRFYYDVESGNSVGSFDWFSLTSTSLVIPHVTASSFDYQTSPQSVSITFDMDIEPTSLTASDLQVRRHPNATAFAPASVNYDEATRTATFYFNTPLADGNYIAKLTAGSVQTPAGNVSPEYSMSFFTLVGDANRDRVVNFSDLLIVAQNYGQSNRNFSQGNFDYSADGLVNFNDLLIVAQKYGMSIFAKSGFESSSTFGGMRIARDVLGDEQRDRIKSGNVLKGM